MTYDELIKQIVNPDTGAEANRQLAEMGAAAIPLLAESIRKLAGPPKPLADVMLQIRGKDAVAQFLKLISDDDTMVQLASLEALGYLADPSAVKPLEQFLQDDKQLPTPKEIAATALGNLGSEESIPVLIALMTQAEKEKKHSLAIACAVALAKLGNHEGFAVVTRALKIKSQPVIRTAAANALCYVTGKGMFSVLQTAMKDKYYEVRRATAEALYYLGTRKAAELLVQALKDKDEATANNAMVYLQRITGDSFEDGAEIRGWWKTNQERFETDVCYRLGVPIKLDAFAEMIKDPLAQFDVVREFSIYTGRQFGADAYVRAHLDEISAQVVKLARELAPQYVAGAVYKAGVRIDLPTLSQ